MTDPQRRAVDALIDWYRGEDPARGITPGKALIAIREANLIILDQETVAAAVAVAKSFTPRWTEYECFTQMQDALGGDE